MADNLTKEQRHKNMKNIRGKDTSIEIKFRKALYHAGFRYLKNVSGMTGKRDIVLTKYKTVIFIHGCFWHRHTDCKYATMPDTNKDYWNKKFQDTINRDKLEQKILSEAGWNIIVIWECEIKSSFDDILNKTIKQILSNQYK